VDAFRTLALAPPLELKQLFGLLGQWREAGAAA